VRQRATETRTARHAAGDARAAALSPPAYGIDFVDQGVVQRKRKGKVGDEYIRKVLAEVSDKDLHAQLVDAWKLIQERGEALYESEITMSQGGYDADRKKVVLYIPEQSLIQWADTGIEKKGIAIHELVHVAEVIANSGGMADMSATDKSRTRIMETDVPDLLDRMLKIFGLLIGERKVFEAVSYKSSSASKEPTLYGYFYERLNYGTAPLDMKDKSTSHEAVTVVSQLVYVAQAKGGAVLQTKTYAALVELQQEMIASRAKRYAAKLPKGEHKKKAEVE
jgi:hypothetical protein